MIDQDLYKVCPVCDGEYRFDIERCADCGVPLVHPQEIALRDARERPPSPGLDEAVLFTGPRYELPPSDDLVCLCCRYVSALRRLSLALDEARISHRLEPAPYGPPNVGCILVLPADANAAEEVDNGLSGLPLEGPALFNALSQSLEEQEVRDDGLELGSEGLLASTCRRCGATLWLTAPRCPNCGVALPPA